MKTPTKKDYDCVKAVRKERERIAKDTEGMSPKDILEYFDKRRRNYAERNKQNPGSSDS